MNKTSIGALLVVASAAIAGAGCGPVAPATPTWERDIHPLMVARCIRCHEEGGHIDPLTSGLAHNAGATAAAISFNYPTLPVPIPSSLMLLKSKGPASVRGVDGSFPRMPPSPAEALEDWQIDMLANWAAEDPLR